jgi:plasmid stability protein
MGTVHRSFQHFDLRFLGYNRPFAEGTCYNSRVISAFCEEGDSMSPQTLTISMPANLYSRLKQCADVTQRSVEEELLELLTGALADHTVPRDLAETAASLSSLDDARLWQVARGQLTDEASRELEALHWKRQREGLDPDEQQRTIELERLFDRIVLLRSQAAALLKQRGHDVGPLVTS